MSTVDNERMDFVRIVTTAKAGRCIVEPKFVVNNRSKWLMTRGGDFYAYWSERLGTWTQNEQDVTDDIDQMLREFVAARPDLAGAEVRWMKDADSGVIDKWHKLVQKQMRDNFVPLDETLTFANSEMTRERHASKRLSYALAPGDYSAYDELIGTLYAKTERHKIEWAIGSVVAGDSKWIQKFYVFFGSHGTGKSTILHIIEQLFDGYRCEFRAEELVSNNSQFGMDAFKENSLVAIQHDSKLDRIENNAQLNSIVSHEDMEINPKYGKKYSMRIIAALFLGTNTPVRITEAKSGLIRRLIDIRPTGVTIPGDRYDELMRQIPFELGAIAWHCKEVYEKVGGRYYDGYVPTEMISATNDFYAFVDNEFDDFLAANQTTALEAWRRYRKYVEFAGIQYPLNYQRFRAELTNYFAEFVDDTHDKNGKHIRSLYRGFLADKFRSRMYHNDDADETAESDEPDRAASKSIDISKGEERGAGWLEFGIQESVFEQIAAEYPAQYAKPDGSPLESWDRVQTKLEDLDTHELHYVRVPLNHVVIDFDIPDPETGEKSFELNVAAASKFKPTYAELSKSGAGIHLHYIYSGDPTLLDRNYGPHIEQKVFTGLSSLRRKLSLCNNLPIATIGSGLVLKGVQKVIDWGGVENEKHLRAIIKKDLKKQIMGATKPSIDHIYKVLDEAYESGIPYDVRDMRQAIIAFASQSSHQSLYCLKLVTQMKFQSAEQKENEDSAAKKQRIVFFDCEVFPNLFLVNWKYDGDPDDACVRMINPSAAEIEDLVKLPLVGFNNRKYDNHILYARMMGYTNIQLYKLSQKIVNGDREAFFPSAYNLSYTDVYDFCSKKQSLKKWEIALGIHHQELGLPWDQPVPEERWEEVAAYCDNDVNATEKVFHDRMADFQAREMLADLSGLTVNDTTRQHTTKIIFGNERHPQLVYTDLSETFPGYQFIDGKNMYRGEDASFGGYVYANPGVYTNVALLDVASLHPSSIIAMNVFGEYTSRFNDILQARIAIKHKDYEKAKTMLDGKLTPYLGSPDDAKKLAQALKIVINSVYGYTSATFDNPFKDPRNVNNIVALRGALFMMTLRDEVQSRGFEVAHIKTDSIKIPNATPEIIQFCMDFGHKYGYNFEHQATYSRLCLVNDAVYIARHASSEWCKAQYGYVPEECEETSRDYVRWEATGLQFKVPYVYKTLFSKEEIVFDDLCETKSVTSGAIYIDLDEGLAEGEHNYTFIGRVGRFCPMKPGTGGGVLYRVKDDKYAAVTGTKGWRWMEAEMVSRLNKQDDIDLDYYKSQVNDAVESISQYADFEWFVADDTDGPLPDFMNIPEGVTEEEVPFDDSYIVAKKGA